MEASHRPRFANGQEGNIERWYSTVVVKTSGVPQLVGVALGHVDSTPLHAALNEIGLLIEDAERSQRRSCRVEQFLCCGTGSPHVDPFPVDGRPDRTSGEPSEHLGNQRVGVDEESGAAAAVDVIDQ
jgi:hypothetical protein